MSVNLNHDALKTMMHEDAKRIETELERLFIAPDGMPEELYEAMRYSLLCGGKRIRPFLVLAFCRMHGGDERAALPYACAIEALHTYSLIHDDMPCLDNDDFRRGAPTCPKKFGEGTAMLAGDAMQAAAFGIAAENTFADDAQTRAAIKALAYAAGPAGMAGGQMLDLIGERSRLSYGQLLKMNTLKTCRFISVSCMLGCIAAGVLGGEELDAAEKYGEALGLCFQLTDDLLDRDTEKQEKTTFLSFMGEDEARKLAAELTEKAKASVKRDGGEILSELADLLLSRDK